MELSGKMLFVVVVKKVYVTCWKSVFMLNPKLLLNIINALQREWRTDVLSFASHFPKKKKKKKKKLMG